MKASIDPPSGLLSRLLRFALEERLIVFLVFAVLSVQALRVAPFDWGLDWVPRDPIPVDAIPDLGENQQIVFTKWPGRSPQDVEDQITYPLTVALLGVPDVRTVRSFSMFGFSAIYVIFEESVDFYWSRSRVLEKLASLPGAALPNGVSPALGPDATALGQVFWYTLEGRDSQGRPSGGFGLHELRTIQDWIVRYALASAEGISEIASIGGHVQEYQIDVDPDAMRAHGVALQDVFGAVRMSNLDVGARTIEINGVEYVIRGVGFVDSLKDIEQTVVRVTDNVPIYVGDVANVSFGPGLRRGALDKAGVEAVGGVAVVRYGYNPLEAIENVKAEIGSIASGLPAKAMIDAALAEPGEVAAFAERHGLGMNGNEPEHGEWLEWMHTSGSDAWPAWLEESRVTIVPFYDRSELIHETLGTLSDALFDEILVTIIVVVLMVMHLASSLVISALLPIAVGATFVLMSVFGVDANVVALGGIAIAIGTMVDMGIVVCENILRHLDAAEEGESRMDVIHRACVEVAGAVTTAVATTVVSFLPVFAMSGAEGKLFQPLAYTKTFALLASIAVALLLLPPAAYLLFGKKNQSAGLRPRTAWLLIAGGVLLAFLGFPRTAGLCAVVGVIGLVHPLVPAWARSLARYGTYALTVAVVGFFLARHWMPLGVGAGDGSNLVFVGLLVLGTCFAFLLVRRVYPSILAWSLEHKLISLTLPAFFVVFGLCAWLGFERVFAFVPAVAERLGADGGEIQESASWRRAAGDLPGIGKEFMPDLDEGSFLLMPSTMAHASIGEALHVLQTQDRALANIPEVESVVGKIGRVDSALDPAPVGMIETIIDYRSEYRTDESGRPLRFRFDEVAGEFARDASGELIADDDGRPFRQWRDHIQSRDDIWDEIVKAARIPGTTSAPKLQPIAARLVMLQSGMRAPMGIKVRGPDLETIEQIGLRLEELLREVPGVAADSVLADRPVGKPYFEIELDREALARHGLHVRSVQEVIEVAIGGTPLTTTVEGRERYAIRVRYARELRDDYESLGRIYVPTSSGAQIPLSQLADIRFVRGPQAIKSEDTQLVGYVIFDKLTGWAEVDVVERCQDYLREKLESGELILPPGVSYVFAGSYENQLHAQRTLAVVLPLALLTVFLLLYLQFRSTYTTLIVWAGVLVAWAGGFILLWLYSQPWFLDFEYDGHSMREVFGVGPRNLSVAVWVGFLALFGIATDDGVVMATYLSQSFKEKKPMTRAAVRATALAAGCRRVRPCLMTTATTLLALLPVLGATGRGADVLVPMAIPCFGGMLVEVVTMFVVPVLYCWREERRLQS